MGKEQPGDGLKKKIGFSARDLLRNTSELARGVQQTIDEGDFDPLEVAAALHLIEGISRTIREGVESGKGDVIFSRDHISANQPPLQEIQSELYSEQGTVLAKEKILNYQDKPKPFGELLILRLDKALPDGKESFTRQELKVFTKGIGGARKILESEVRASFGREKAITLLQKVLTTPSKILDIDRTGEFDRRQILKHFPLLRGSDLDEWSLAVGHDWSSSKTQKVNFEEAMQIRGLFMLRKLNLPPKTPVPALPFTNNDK